MATINNVPGEMAKPLYIGPHGNQWSEVYKVESSSAGKINGTAVGTGDVVRAGVLPSGLKLDPAKFAAMVSDAFTANATVKIGFAFTDGTATKNGVVQDDDYFLTATTASQAIQRGNNAAVAPITLPADAHLIITFAAAALSDAGRMDLSVSGVYTGTA